MASVEVMKERARIAGCFNLSAQQAGGECHVIPVAPGEDDAEVLHRAYKIAGGSPVIIVTEANGSFTPASSM